MENLNYIVNKAIAKPCTRSGLVLYTREDSNLEDENGNMIKISDDDKKSGIANSPDNLRRLFITHRNIVTQYHLPVQGVSDKGLKREYSVDGKFGDLAERIRAVFNNDIIKCSASELRRFRESRNLPKEDLVDIKGFGLGALYKPWVYQNIEEIYFNWLPFTCFTKSGTMDISTMGNNIVSIMLGMVYDSCGVSSVDELCKRYPRLHTIGYFRNLDQLIQDNPDSLNGTLDTKIQRRLMTWASLVTNGYTGMNVSDKVISDDGVAILKLRKGHSWMLDYSAKCGIYTFDSQLQSHFDTLINKYKETYSINKQDTGKRPTEKGTIELSMDRVRDTQGAKAVENLIRVAIATKQCTLKQLESELTEDGYTNYKELLSKLR